jgi:GxxExxY protein
MSIVHRSPLAYKVIGCAMAVHDELGPGLTEAPYGRGFKYELSAAGLSYRSEVMIPIVYKGTPLDCGYRADFIVENEILIEIKSVEHLLPVHSAQIMAYQKLTRVPHALLFNFNVTRLKNGMKSFLLRDGKPQLEENEGLG